MLRLAMLAIFALGAAGCAGIHQSGSVSPLDFFLPGVGSFMKVDPGSTNAPASPASFPAIPPQFASNK